ncbi:MAG: hypothetical protein KFH98_00340, partial [Gemmatimonadetes bacterium]|nr:hypothetical protein [Gemmatimonadota bacterium]
MRHRTVLLIAAGVGLAASCAGTAMVRPEEAVPGGTAGTSDRHRDESPIEPTRVTLTPVTVHAGGRMTPRPESGSTTAERVVLEEAEGGATYYAGMFDGRRTASGIVFRNSEAYAAHRTWPFGTVVR